MPRSSNYRKPNSSRSPSSHKQATNILPSTKQPITSQPIPQPVPQPSTQPSTQPVSQPVPSLGSTIMSGVTSGFGFGIGTRIVGSIFGSSSHNSSEKTINGTDSEKSVSTIETPYKKCFNESEIFFKCIQINGTGMCFEQEQMLNKCLQFSNSNNNELK